MKATPKHIAVIDIGKTNAKVLVFDLMAQREVERFDTPNHVITSGLYPHYDTEGLWQFILKSLKALAARHKVDAISITTHGASAVLLAEDDSLAMPALDYEYHGPDAVAQDYDALRPPFEESGSPRLPGGLNVGAQIFWQAKAFPNEFAKTRWLVTYPQYWAHRLTGVLANEATSLGAHTDLWAYAKRDYSSLVDKMNWRRLMPEVRKAQDCLGSLRPEVASQTGLPVSTPVHCGIHDSNASLLPHLLAHKPPFAVVSTGTWVISMAIGGKPVKLDPTRDTLMNINAFKDPVPSARFMGGREFEMLKAHFGAPPTAQDEAYVLQHQAMLKPAIVEDCGPFAGRKAKWLNDKDLTPPQKQVVASFYLAMMTKTCLDLIGTKGSVIVEGPFASNAHFMAMLAATTGLACIATAKSTGTSLGAALLASGDTKFAEAPGQTASFTKAHVAYAKAWQAALAEA